MLLHGDSDMIPSRCSYDPYLQIQIPTTMSSLRLKCSHRATRCSLGYFALVDYYPKYPYCAGPGQVAVPTQSRYCP